MAGAVAAPRMKAGPDAGYVCRCGIARWLDRQRAWWRDTTGATASTRSAAHETGDATASIQTRPHETGDATAAASTLPIETTNTTDNACSAPHETTGTTTSTRARPHETADATDNTKHGNLAQKPPTKAPPVSPDRPTPSPKRNRRHHCQLARTRVKPQAPLPQCRHSRSKPLTPLPARTQTRMKPQTPPTTQNTAI